MDVAAGSGSGDADGHGGHAGQGGKKRAHNKFFSGKAFHNTESSLLPEHVRMFVATYYNGKVD